ncbi:MAG: hypothetical protein R3A44_06535 [Caldilineaceae bacterium]
MPMPAIASDRLVDLHNDVTHYDMIISGQVAEFMGGENINPRMIAIDKELEESLRAFKVETPEEVECRRELLRYKRQIDDVVRELIRFSNSSNTHS